MFAGNINPNAKWKTQKPSHDISFDVNYVPSILLENWNKMQSVISESLKPEGRGKYTAYCYLTLSPLPVPVQQNMSI